ncbi:hypothetical protein FQB35_14335 [Crassaminicella thermophila]|uniref:Uncharacterized protein n=1 Tax=Crassaminicella thermophila TaxID=2599308 RepID=A0A5C0SFJ1_CRATE|nr:hypothetical protein [Crassaminicella thermophila]QEK13355.1 hypothetical protein FQB35_14335 [Crassaminicella thermophila]
MIVNIDMYKNFGERRERNITGNVKADQVYRKIFAQKHVKNKSELKKVFWNELKQLFIKKQQNTNFSYRYKQIN